MFGVIPPPIEVSGTFSVVDGCSFAVSDFNFVPYLGSPFQYRWFGVRLSNSSQGILLSDAAVLPGRGQNLTYDLFSNQALYVVPTLIALFLVSFSLSCSPPTHHLFISTFHPTNNFHLTPFPATNTHNILPVASRSHMRISALYTSLISTTISLWQELVSRNPTPDPPGMLLLALLISLFRAPSSLACLRLPPCFSFPSKQSFYKNE